MSITKDLLRNAMATITRQPEDIAKLINEVATLKDSDLDPTAPSKPPASTPDPKPLGRKPSYAVMTSYSSSSKGPPPTTRKARPEPLFKSAFTKDQRELILQLASPSSQENQTFINTILPAAIQSITATVVRFRLAKSSVKSNLVLMTTPAINSGVALPHTEAIVSSIA